MISKNFDFRKIGTFSLAEKSWRQKMVMVRLRRVGRLGGGRTRSGADGGRTGARLAEATTQI